MGFKIDEKNLLPVSFGSNPMLFAKGKWYILCKFCDMSNCFSVTVPDEWSTSWNVKSYFHIKFWLVLNMICETRFTKNSFTTWKWVSVLTPNISLGFPTEDRPMSWLTSFFYAMSDVQKRTDFHTHWKLNFGHDSTWFLFCIGLVAITLFTSKTVWFYNVVLVLL